MLHFNLIEAITITTSLELIFSYAMMLLQVEITTTYQISTMYAIPMYSAITTGKINLTFYYTVTHT